MKVGYLREIAGWILDDNELKDVQVTQRNGKGLYDFTSVDVASDSVPWKGASGCVEYAIETNAKEIAAAKSE